MENEIKNIESIDLKFTEEELKELATARSKTIVFDADCPETTPDRALRFRRVNTPRKVLGAE